MTLSARTVALCLTLFVVPAVGSHLTFQPGDLFTGGVTHGVFPGTETGKLDWYHQNLTLNRRLADTFRFRPEDFAFDPDGNLYVVDVGSGRFPIHKYDRSGTPIGFFGSVILPVGIVFDAAGFAYMSGGEFGKELFKVDRSGATVATFALKVNRALDQASDIDLAGDQCTLYYTAGFTSILRFNVCSGAQMADFISAVPTGERVASVLLVGTSGLLVSQLRHITLFSPTGVKVRTYDLPDTDSWWGIALDVDGRSFWAASGRVVAKFRLTDGQLLTTFMVNNDLADLAVFGEPRAINHPAAIPTLSEVALAVLAAALFAVALRRLA